MNPFLNPIIVAKTLKCFFIDPSRTERLKPEQLKQYQDKAFKKIVKYAYNVPMYHEIYKKAGINPNDIRGIKDIVKLPFITKNDLRNNFPDRILPLNYNKKNGFVISTGGTSGKSVFLYTDITTMIQSTVPSSRETRFFNLSTRKSRFAHIGNFSPYRIDLVFEEKFYSNIKRFISMNNILNLDVNQPMTDIVKKLDDFKPDVIMSYPNIHQNLAFLKRKGYGKNIQPKLLTVGGSMIDDYVRRYVEDAFGCRLLNIYPSVEAGTNIAFECLEGTWHIHPDYFYVEAVDEHSNRVPYGKRGQIVITKLYGQGTPIVRYTGMEDWIRFIPVKECSCGLTTPVIESFEGRMGANIVLSNGKIFPSGAFCFIEPVLNKFNTFKVKQYQIVQKEIDEIDIFLVIDEDLRNVGASVEEIAEEIKHVYQQKVGPDVIITVKEVDEIKNPKDASKPAPIVISHVKTKDGYDIANSPL
jgi:phenylacetate-CoA ligase